jgi:hypothetical protein
MVKQSRISVLEAALAGAFERIAVIERMLGGLPTDEPVVAGCGGDRRLSKAALARRWGKSPRTIDRMREQPSFPECDVINGQCTWWLSTVQKYERATQAGGMAPDRSQYLTRNKASTEASAAS